MPRKNNRPHPPEQRTHQLDSFTMWAEKIIAENGRKMSIVGDTPTSMKSPPQRIINNRKKGDENNAEK